MTVNKMLLGYLELKRTWEPSVNTPAFLTTPNFFRILESLRVRNLIVRFASLSELGK